MPDQSSHSAALSANKHVLFGYLFIFERGDPVLVATVSATPVFPAFDIAVSVVSGSASNVRHGMLYTVETTGGLYKGMSNLRWAGTISSGNLPVRELSRGVIDVEAGDVVKVYRYWLPGDMLVGATKDFNPDGLSYTDQGSNPPPMANDGGAWAGLSSQLPIPLTGSLSYVVDPDSGGTPTHSRILPTGLTFDTGDADDTDVMITGDPGTYWVEDVVTDPGNSKTTTRFTPICISDTPLDCQVEPYGGDMDNGWRMTVRLYDAVSIPEGTIAAFVSREFIGGVEGSFGSPAPGRSHIKFLGIVRRLTAEGSAERQSVSYEFLSPLAWMMETPGFSKVMLDSATPDDWSKLKTLNTKRAKIQIIQFYTSLNRVGYDVIFNSNYRNKRYPGFFLEKNTPVGQLGELADGVGARLVCNRHGRFEFFTRPRLLTMGSRSSVPTMLTPSLDDIKDYSIQQEMKDPIEKIYFSGFVAGASNNAPFRVAYPGKAPGTGVESPQFEKMICDNIPDAEAEAGRRGALVQLVFVKSSKEKLRAHILEVTLFGSLDVFDLYGEWVGMPELPNMAGIDTSKFRYEIDSIGVEYSNGTGAITLRMTSETNAPPGQYDPPAVEAPPGIDPFPPDGDWWEDPIDDQIISVGTNGLGVRRLLVAGAGGSDVAYASDDNGLPNSPTWMDRSSGLTGSAVHWLQVDPWNFDAWYACCSDGIWRTPDVKGGAPWVRILDNSRLDSMSHHYHFILLSPYRQGWILAAAGQNHLDESPNYGGGWTTVNMSGGADARTSTVSDEIYQCYPELSWHNGGGLLWGGICYGTPGGTDTGRKVMRSTSWGLSWSVAATLGAQSAESSRVFCPFLRLDGSPNLPDSNQLILARNGSKAAGAASADLYRSQNGASSFTLVDSSANTYSAQDTPLARGMCDYEDTGGVYAFLQRQNGGAATDRRVAYTEDGFASHVVCDNQPASNGMRDLRCLPRGNRHWLVAFGTGGGGMLEVTTDRGASPWINATGNLASLWGDTLVSYATAL